MVVSLAYHNISYVYLYPQEQQDTAPLDGANGELVETEIGWSFGDYARFAQLP